ncbi:hypothetical protein AYL99_11653 [Fonsecaea erecta]|uniref:Uncharacterized protein n=1 Tax=Fonsecaea erecta TaxID=1367422 RepID=A0A178Z2T2_9EURO|nr:hypothetical protein AYL99_11653 [Fonsecaea erecta]OAP54118.1 hypothetical protein AYL99_11653 [Fonsecaea erecta]
MSSASTPQRKPIADLLLVSPISAGQLSVSPRKRKITPTAEATSPKKLAVITSLGAVSPFANSIPRTILPNPLRWPGHAELAHIDERSSLYEFTRNPLKMDTSGQEFTPNPLKMNTSGQEFTPNPLKMDTPEQDLQQSPPLARHLIFSFDLRNDKSGWADPKKMPLLRSVVPGTTGISCDGWFIYLLVRTLPPKPWPLTIAGLPLYFHTPTTLGQGPLPQGKLVTRKNGYLAEDQDYRNMKNWEPLFKVIQKHFEENINISITEVIYLGNVVYIVLEHRQTDMTKVPWLIGKATCVYLYDDEMGRPSKLHARRQHDLTQGNPDISMYDTLQPGLRVTSNYLPDSSDAYLETTTGVLLKDSVGNEFMTVAAHGFPSEAGTTVFHVSPGETGRVIGELIMEITHTDIALVKLAATEKFSNVTFQNDQMPESTQLRRLCPTEHYGQLSPICLDSPDSGFLDGYFMAPAFAKMSADDGSPTQHWAYTTWSYMGEDAAAKLPEGMCGSAMWDANGNVLGFFRYAAVEGAMKNWRAGIAADELINRGYTLADTPDVK